MATVLKPIKGLRYLTAAFFIASCLTIPFLPNEQKISALFAVPALFVAQPFYWLFGKAAFVFPITLSLIGIQKICGVHYTKQIRWFSRLGSLPVFMACLFTGYALMTVQDPYIGGVVGVIYFNYWREFIGVSLAVPLGSTFLMVIFLTLWKIISWKKFFHFMQPIFRAGLKKSIIFIQIRTNVLKNKFCLKSNVSEEVNRHKKLVRDIVVLPDKKKVEKDDVHSHTTPQENLKKNHSPLPLPETTNPIPIGILPDSTIKNPCREKLADNLGDLQRKIQSVVRDVTQLEISPVSRPQVCLSCIKFTFNKSDMSKGTISKIIQTIPDIGLKTGRSPVHIDINDTINIELPLQHDERDYVPIKQLLLECSRPERKKNQEITYLMGRDLSGQPVELPVRSAKHILVAGATGSGKTCFLHSLIFSVIFRFSAKDVRFALVDFKCFEFSRYRGAHHLWQDIVTTDEGYCQLIDDLNTELTSRKRKKINNANAKFPILITVIDEFRGHNSDTLIKLISEARALDMFFILATQHPVADVISTSIKANLITNIAFRVRSPQASHLILGHADAIHLLGAGDYFMQSEGSELVRIQSGWVKEGNGSDIEALAKYLSGNSKEK